MPPTTTTDAAAAASTSSTTSTTTSTTSTTTTTTTVAPVESSAPPESSEPPALEEAPVADQLVADDLSMTLAVAEAPAAEPAVVMAAAAPTYLQPRYTDNIYVVESSGARVVSFAEWQAAGFPTPQAAPTEYVKYPWSTTIYAVTKWSAGPWLWERLSFGQWDRAGRPAPANTYNVAGSYFYQWGTSSEVLVEGPDGVNHVLSGGEYAAAGGPAPDRRSNEGFVKFAWNPNIYRMSNLAGTVGRVMGFPEWSEEGFPNPQIVTRVPGDRLTRSEGDSTIYYTSALLSKALTYGEWVAMGSPAPVVTAQTAPANSGSGRRVVYSRSQQRVWAVDDANNLIKTHRVSGRTYEPYAGAYSVFSRSLNTYSNANPNVIWRYMVRFTRGPGGDNIGFHEIPTKFGVPLQSTAQLGQPLSGGCVRQATPDALWMWNFAGIGTRVVVL